MRTQISRRIRFTLTTVAAIALATQCSRSALAEVKDAKWTGLGGNWNWGTANNWQPQVVPNNGTPPGDDYNVKIDNPNAMVLVNGSFESSQRGQRLFQSLDELRCDGRRPAECCIRAIPGDNAGRVAWLGMALT